MNSIHALLNSRAALRLKLPLLTLIALLQRSPMVRLLTSAGDLFADSGPGNGFVLRASVVSAAALGAIDTLAGATSYLLNATKATPVSATVGTAVGPILFTVSNTIYTGSWRVGGTIPPGMSVKANEGNGATLTGTGGLLDATTAGVSDIYGGMTGGNSQTTPVLAGTPTAAGSYTITMTAYEYGNAGGLVSPQYSFVVNVAAGVSAPTFSTSPSSQSVNTGASVTFTAAATGGATYQWQKNGQAISGATAAMLTLNSVTTADSATYTVVATNAGGTVSADAVLTVSAAPVKPAFVTQPTAATMNLGSTAVLTAVATGATSFQWSKNGGPIAGATSATYVLNSVAASDAGTYSVTATNSVGSTTSTNAVLATSGSANFGRLINLSVLTPASVSNPLTLGFFIGGNNTSGQEQVLVRATGPALAAFGISAFLPDPTLALIDQGSKVTIATNDNWGTPSGNVTVINNADNATGAFGLANSASLDAALVKSLPAGGYTVQVAGNGSASGTTLAEAYDYTSAFTAATPRLINLSCLANVSAGVSLTAGFTVGGSTSRSVLIRANGPVLGGFGLTGVMPDPTVTVNATGGGNPVVLVSNVGWKGDAAISSLGGKVGAFTISDVASKDSAVVMTLPPGTYTATAQSATGAGGFLLVEIYEVP